MFSSIKSLVSIIKNAPAANNKTSDDIENREMHQIKTGYFKRGIMVIMLFTLKNKMYKPVKTINRIRIVMAKTHEKRNRPS